MTEDAAQEKTMKRSGMRGWVKGVFVLSLALNLAVAGFVIGGVARHGNDMRHGRPTEARSAMADLGFGPVLAALPREHRRALGESLRAQAGSMIENRESLSREVGAVLDAVRATPFDEAAMRDILEEQRTRIDTRVRTARALMVAQIAQMSDDERAQFADRLEHSLEHARQEFRPKRR
jgi:uncharacterized membrane protein